jgi:hypothetical protein
VEHGHDAEERKIADSESPRGSSLGWRLTEWRERAEPALDISATDAQQLAYVHCLILKSCHHTNYRQYCTRFDAVLRGGFLCEEMTPVFELAEL